MCGIAGYLSEKTFSPEVIQKMTDSLFHRGPDEEAFYKDRNYTAGMRRLSINGLKNGSQPLYNRDKSVYLLYNGEIYNSPQLKLELEKDGVNFITDSDGEVICHLYDKYGLDLFEKLDGMFAVALWISKEQKLVLARDIPGEKPLYYFQKNSSEIAFSSEIKSLINFPEISRNLNQQAVWDFPSFLWIPEPETVYQDIKALPAGNLLIVSGEGSSLFPYQKQSTETEALTDEEAIDLTRTTVIEAIESRLLSDVPLGCFLSSGLDSSIVTTITSQQKNDVTTFSIGFDEIDDPYHGKADESTYAAQYAKILGTNHHTIKVTEQDFNRELEVLAYYGDQPFSVSSGMGISCIARRASELGIKVLLSGDCADELFGGYSWYQHLDSISPDSSFTGEPSVSFQNTELDKNKLIEIVSSYNQSQAAWAMHYYASEQEKSCLFSDQVKENSNSSLRYFTGDNWKSLDYLKHDRKFYLPFEMLRKLDRMTMAHSVEGRVPFVSPKILKLVDRLSFDQLVRGENLKWVLREAFRGVLPEEIYTRPKHGFNIPIDHWLKGSWKYLVEETFSPLSALNKHGLLSQNARSKADSMLTDPNRLNGHTIFSYIMLNLWLEN